MLPGLIPFVGLKNSTPIVPATLAFGGSASGHTTGTGNTSITFSSVTLATSANPSVMYVVTVSQSNFDDDILSATQPSGVTLGGVAMTRAVQTSAGNGDIGVSIWYLVSAPLGASANVVVSFSSATAMSCAVGTYTIQGYNRSTPFATTSKTATGTTTATGTINVHDSGIVIMAVAAMTGSGGTVTSTESGVTDNYTLSVSDGDGDNCRSAGASASGLAANSAYALSVATSAGSNKAFVAASFI
jgi:hypothetical protein